jgi:hypothetical protein
VHSDEINHLSRVMPALVAGIHVFLGGCSEGKAWMVGTSPAMTLKKWLNTNGTGARSHQAQGRVA